MELTAPKLSAVVVFVSVLSVGVTPGFSQSNDRDFQGTIDYGYRFPARIFTSYCDASRRGGGLLGRLGSSLIDSLSESHRWGGGEYSVVVQSHYAVVAEMARRAARHFKPAPLLQDVPLDLRTPLLHVSVVPKGDSDKLLDYNMQASIEHIVVGPKDNMSVETAVQPHQALGDRYYRFPEHLRCDLRCS